MTPSRKRILILAFVTCVLSVALVVTWGIQNGSVLRKEGSFFRTKDELYLILGGPSENASQHTRTYREEALSAIDDIPASSVVEFTFVGKTLTVDECRELAALGSLVILKIGGADLPPGGISEIVAGNPRLRYVWIEKCAVGTQLSEAFCAHKSLVAVGAYRSDITDQDKEQIRKCGVAVITDSPFSLIE